MAVYTVISAHEFGDWARRHYGFAQAGAIAPVSAGIENTNYRIQADGNDYIFTIFELWDAEAVSYYTALMHHLNAAALPVPESRCGLNGKRFFDWHGKPALLVPFVEGAPLDAPDEQQCKVIGGLLARLHLAAADFDALRPNPRNQAWRADAAAAVRPHLDAREQRLLDAALQDDARFADAPLPVAACHCDLFRNNVLWRDDAVSGVIDFYFGGHDALIFDLAVCACDWCYRDNLFVPPLLSALIGGYCSQRQLCDLERQLFVDALNAAATRFWLSRHYDIAFPRPAHALVPHDPKPFQNILHTVRSEKQALMQLMKAVA